MNRRLAQRISEIVVPEKPMSKQAGLGAMAGGAGIGIPVGGMAGYAVGSVLGNKVIPTLAGMFGGGAGGILIAEYLARKYAEKAVPPSSSASNIPKDVPPKTPEYKSPPGVPEGAYESKPERTSDDETLPKEKQVKKDEAENVRSTRIADAILALRKEAMENMEKPAEAGKQA